MRTSVRPLLNFSSTLTREQDDSFFSSRILYCMSTTLPPESKTFLQECTISCESIWHFHNFWTRCNDCSTRNVRMHTTYYDMDINIGGSKFVIGRLYSNVVRRAIFTIRKGFVALSRKCWTELEQIRANVERKSWKLVACWKHVEQRSYCRSNSQRNSWWRNVIGTRREARTYDDISTICTRDCSTSIQHVFDICSRLELAREFETVSNSRRCLPSTSDMKRHLFDMYRYVFECYTTHEEMWQVVIRPNSSHQLGTVWPGLYLCIMTVFYIQIVSISCDWLCV
jgi:hypothetical protein